DDHMRNHGFLHVEKDLWRLSPAFDINPFPNKQRALKTWIAEDAGDAASIQTLVDHASYFGIDLNAVRSILSAVESAVSNWQDIGKSLGLTTQELNALESAFEHEERLVARQIVAHTS